eukprot:m.61258 g.61258  ORF g.61258 m.61258 type:complete len:1336 (-) comp7066_c0_seq1:118-4125(-)
MARWFQAALRRRTPLEREDEDVLGLSKDAVERLDLLSYIEGGGGTSHSSAVNSENRLGVDSMASADPSAAEVNASIVREAGRDIGLDFQKNSDGIVISHIESGSPADKGGLQVGDIILGVDGRDFIPGTSSEAAGSALSSASDTLLIRACRQGGALNAVTVIPKPPSEPRLSSLVKLISERSDHGVEHITTEFGGIEGLARSLSSDLEHGIQSEEAIKNSQYYFGKNSVPKPRSPSLLELMWDALHDPTLIVLLIAGIISLILGFTVEKDEPAAWIEGLAILVAVLIVVMVTAINDKQKDKQFKDLQAKQDSEKVVTVTRMGVQQSINFTDVVVGDLVMLVQGAIVPADGIFVRGSDNLACDESALTGESKDITKNAEHPFILSGTSVKLGAGVYLVTCVGLFSEEGLINKIITGVGADETRELNEREASKHNTSAASLNETPEEIEERKKLAEEREKAEAAKPSARKKESLLQAKLTNMAALIGYIGTAVAILVVLVLILRYVIEHYGVNGESYSSGLWPKLLSFVIIGITVLVVAVPEGLPLAVAISLAFSVKKMMADHNLVRVLASCETMGNATTICSDKTGTLTKNRMTVVRSWIAGNDYSDLAEIPKAVSEVLRSRISQHIAFNSSPETNYKFVEGNNLPIQDGNKTECAIMYFADQICTRKVIEVRGDVPHSRLKSFPFDSAKKRMTTLLPLSGGGYRVFVKGAAEIILQFCTQRENADGTLTPVTEADKAQLVSSVISSYADQALRVILLAYKDLPNMPSDVEDDYVNDLIISAFVGIQDPVRDEVPEAVKQCQRAGVIVRMVTGDNMVTARAIAYNCNILSRTSETLGQYTVMEGPDFRRRVVKEDGSLNYEVLFEICKQLRVMGRCSPSDKYNLVKGLRHFGEVVAVTGDGTNDGPALSEADVGFAMGIAGTGVAKEASDIIITDDNFSSIVKAISWGRNVYDSISKFLVFQLTVNFVAITLAFIGSCVLNESPISAVQMLWVNLIMDSLASLALATEPPKPDLLDRKPYDRSQPLITPIMARNIITHGLYQLAICFMVVWAGDSIFSIPSGRGNAQDPGNDPTQHYTIVFNAFVWMQLFNEINCRFIHNEINVFRGFFSNYYFLAVWFITAILQVLIIEFGSFAFKTKGLSYDQWLFCVGIGATEIPLHILMTLLIPTSIFPEFMAKRMRPKPRPKLDEVKLEDAPDVPAAAAVVAAEAVAVAETDLEEIRRAHTMPIEQAQRFRRDRAVSDMWKTSVGRIQRQVSVIAAFRSAGIRMQQRRKTIRDVSEEEAQRLHELRMREQAAAAAATAAAAPAAAAEPAHSDSHQTLLENPTVGSYADSVV